MSAKISLPTDYPPLPAIPWPCPPPLTMAQKRAIITAQKEHVRLTAAGYRRHETDWEIHRGALIGQQIVDAIISSDGLYVYTKVAPAPHRPERPPVERRET